MSLLETQNFLARIYTDEKLRHAFLSDPHKIGRENDLDDAEIFQLAEIMPEELSFFAESLFYKRLGEVEKLLPLTRRFLGQDFEKHFREFASLFNPDTIKKHLEDAVRFAEFLREKEIKPSFIKDLSEFERARLVFNGYNKKILFRRFDHDIRSILHNAFSGQIELQDLSPPKRRTHSIWTRIGGRTRHYIW